MKNLVEPIKSKKTISLIEKELGKRNIRNQLIWVLGINSGLRVSDILSLNIEDVKDKNYIEIKEKKTKKYKRFPLNDKLKKLIKSYLKIRMDKYYSVVEDEPLFLGKKHKRLDRSQVYRFLNEVCEDLNIKANIGTHTMRKTFGYFFYQQFNNVALLQKILNHSSPSITLRYIGIAQEEIDDSYSNFEL